MSIKKNSAMKAYGMFMAMGSALETEHNQRLANQIKDVSYEEEEKQKKIRDQKRSEHLKLKRKRKQEEIKKKKGLTKFEYGGNHVWALNKKNADRKAKKKGFLSED